MTVPDASIFRLSLTKLTRSLAMTIRFLAILPAIAITLYGSITCGQYAPNLREPITTQNSQPTSAERLIRYREQIDAKVSRSQTKMLTTLDGNFIFQFPNYDIAINGTPPYPGQGNGTPRISADGGQPQSQLSSTRVIWKNDQGYSWDGSNFLLSPNYSYELYTGEQFRRQLIGQRDQLWTPNKCEPRHDGASDPDAEIAPLPFQPTVTKSARTLEMMQSTLPKTTWGRSTQGATNEKQGDKKLEKLELDEMENQLPNNSTSRRTDQPRSPRSTTIRAPHASFVTPQTLTRRPVTNNRSLNSSNIDFLRNGFAPSSGRTVNPLPRPTSPPAYRLPEPHRRSNH